MFTTSAIVQISEEACVGCTRCVNVCPSEALAMEGRLAVLDEPKCVGCFKCLEACIPYNAISIRRDPNPRQLGVPAERWDRPEVTELCAKARFDPQQAICMCTSTTAAEVAAAIVDGDRGRDFGGRRAGAHADRLLGVEARPRSSTASASPRS